MNTLTENSKYEYKHKKPTDKHLICPECTKPFVDPVSTNCDPKPHTFCRNCIEKWIKIDPSCPTCNQKLHIEDLTPIRTVIVNDMLNDLLVKCLGCKQTDLKRIDFDAHYNENCPKADVQCSSSDNMCSWTGTRDQLEQHLKTCTIDLIKSLTIAFQTYGQQIEDKINQLQTQNERLKNDNKQLNDKINKQRTPIIGPMKADQPLIDKVNYQQTQPGEPIKVDKPPNDKVIQLLQQFAGILNQQRTETEMITKDNQELNLKLDELQIQNIALKAENQQLKNATAKSQKQQDNRYHYKMQVHNLDSNSGTGNYPRTTHTANQPPRCADHGLLSRDYHLAESANNGHSMSRTSSNIDVHYNAGGGNNNNIVDGVRNNTAASGDNNNIVDSSRNNTAGGNNNAAGNNIAGNSRNHIDIGINDNGVNAGGIINVGDINHAVRIINAGGIVNIGAGNNNPGGDNNNNIAGRNNNFIGNNNHRRNGHNHSINGDDSQDDTSSSGTNPLEDHRSDTFSTDRRACRTRSGLPT